MKKVVDFKDVIYPAAYRFPASHVMWLVDNYSNASSQQLRSSIAVSSQESIGECVRSAKDKFYATDTGGLKPEWSKPDAVVLTPEVESSGYSER